MTYTVNQLERLLTNYVTIRGMLAGDPPSGDGDPYFHDTVDNGRGPFSQPKHAKVPRDGKARARAREELHCAVIDIESALTAEDEDGYPRISNNDCWLIVWYWIYRKYTLEELCEHVGHASRGSMLRRCRRAVSNLLAEIERPKGRGVDS